MIAITIVVLAIVGVSGGAYFLGQRLQRAKQIASAEEARARMDSVRDSSAADTADRLRAGDF